MSRSSQRLRTLTPRLGPAGTIHILNISIDVRYISALNTFPLPAWRADASGGTALVRVAVMGFSKKQAFRMVEVA